LAILIESLWPSSHFGSRNLSIHSHKYSIYILNSSYSFLVYGTFNLGDYVFDLIFRESITLLFRVQFDPALSLILLAVCEQSHFQSRRDPLILIEVVLKHPSLLWLSLGFVVAVPVVLLQSLDRRHDLSAVASAATELELDHVRRFFVAQDLTGSRRGSGGVSLSSS
jgi:hypothetical protein